MQGETRTNRQLVTELQRERERNAKLTLELRQAQEEASAAKHARAALLAHLSHELRTPVSGILGLAELALAKGPSARDPLYFELIKESGVSLLYMVDNLLNLTQIVSGHVGLTPVVFSVRNLTESVLDSFRENALSKGVALSCAVIPEVPDRLMGDLDKLHQALTRLVDNALKYTQHGHVRISVELADGTSIPDSVRLCFHVEDNGIGIPECRLTSLFESFAQVGTAPHDKSRGLGVGLATAKSLIELMGGSLWVESTPGRGSTFSFKLSFGSAEGLP